MQAAEPVVVVLGASAGGVEALTHLVARLPGDLLAAVCVVLHTAPGARSMLPAILARAGTLPASHAADSTPLVPGHIYAAPPDRHLIVAGNILRTTRRARENGHRPSIDVLFRSAARTHRRRVIGAILSGADDDGTEGLLMIKAHGGLALAQDPSEAVFDRMPRSAVEHVPLDAVLPVAALAARIAHECRTLVTEVPEGESAMQSEPHPEREIERVEAAIDAWERGSPTATASGFRCPSCGGGIWQSWEGPLLRFSCHTGHVFSADSFANEQAELLDTTLWQAVRVLSERVSLFRQFATHQAAGATSGRYAEQADELERGVALLRNLLQQSGS